MAADWILGALESLYPESINSSFVSTSTVLSTLNTSVNTPPDDQELIDYVGYICVPLLLILGVTGNTLTIVVMCSKAFYRMSVSRILIALAVSDTLLIVLLPFNKLFVRTFLGVDIRALSDAGCKTFFWAFRTAKMTSSWLVVLISIERFIAVWFPFHAKEINTTKKAILAILSVYIVIGTYNGVWCSITDQIIGGICIPNTRPPGLEQVTGGFLVTGLTIYCFLPATILCVLNTLIVIQIVQSMKRAHRMQTGVNKDMNKKPTIMLIGIAVAFIILVTPIASAHLISYVKKQNIFESSEPWVVFLREVAQLMEQLNYSINFFLYVLLGELFRTRLRETFGRCRKRASEVYSENRNSSSTSSAQFLTGSVGSVVRYNKTKRKNSAQMLDNSDLSEGRSSPLVNFEDNPIPVEDEKSQIMKSEETVL